MNHYVYEITNLINGKKYIGKRSCKCSIEEDKYMGSGKLLKKAIDKYGKENFKKEILQTCENERMAYEWEKVYIEQVKAYSNSNYYNISSGGNGGWGNFAGKTKEEMQLRSLRISKKTKGKLTGDKNPNYGGLKEATKIKLSALAKERLKNKNNHPLYGKHHSDKTKEKIRKTLTGKYVGENHPFYGRKHSDETKSLIGLKNKGKTMSNETKKKISKALTGKHYHSDKYKEALSNRFKGENNPMYGVKGELHPTSRKVVCLNNNKIFNSCAEAGLFINRGPSNIIACCQGKTLFCGEFENEFLVWMYYEDYIKTNQIKIEEKLMFANKKNIISLNTLEKFKTTIEAQNKYGIDGTSIGRCCKGKQGYAGKINGEPARWMYYEDYIKLNSK